MNADGEVSPKERRFLERRIRIAQEYKRQTNGEGTIMAWLYGEREEDCCQFRTAKTMTQAEIAERDQRRIVARQQARFNHKLATTRRFQARKNGTYGITVVPNCSHGRQRWRAHVDKRAVAFDCAVEAAEYRNAIMAERYPAYPDFQINLESIWEKWGCSCGKHKRSDA